MTGRAEAMSFSNFLKRKQPAPGSAGKAPERPTSATASVEFWRAFLRQDAEPTSAFVQQGSPAAFAGQSSSETMKARADAAPSVEPRDIARELGLSRFASVRALQRLRRDFALKNHPDRMPSTLRVQATKRMMIANALIDSAVKRFQLGAVREVPARPFENGDRI